MSAVHTLLLTARAAQAAAPTLATHRRHVADGLGTGDPLLWIHVFAFQAEPFQPGGYAWADVDSDTGEIGDIQLAVADHPLDRETGYAAAARFGHRLVSHLDRPHLDRTDDTGSTLDPADGSVQPDVLARVLIANPQVADKLRTLGRRFTYTALPDDSDEATTARVLGLRRTGQWLRELHQASQRAGQSLVVDVLSHLTNLYVVPLSHHEQGHLGAVIAAITGGTTAAWDAEDVAIGPLPSSEVQNELWEAHTALRAASRRGDTATADLTRELLTGRYADLARTTADTVTAGLRLLNAVEDEPRFAAIRRTEDLKAYTRSAAFLLGATSGRRAAVQSISSNDRTLATLETARAVHELRVLVTEPRQRCQLWAHGAVAEGVRIGSNRHRIPTGGTTPTGRPQQVNVVDVVLDVTVGVTPPRLGARLVWHGDGNLQTSGEVIHVNGQKVCIRVTRDGVNEVSRPFHDGRYDVWVEGDPPFLGLPPVVKAADLPATHRSPRTADVIDDGDTDATADAILATPVTEDGKDYS